ncbi:MAG: hypothetical protein JST79_08990 [Acidobacteria bacterium]|nr:hypothetical protein [Acidobacteriota bacterium]
MLKLLLSLAIILLLQASAFAQVKDAKSFPLWNFDEREGTCRAKGRLQDIGYCSSKTMDQILARGKDAIPILISQITDTRPTRKPIYDFWPEMTVGDVAAFILSDLFLDADWVTFNMPGLEALHDDCKDPAWVCWDRFLQKHGRKFVQSQWQAAWEKNKDNIYWDAKARCFRVK